MGIHHDKFRDSDIRKRAEERFSKQLDTFAALAEKDKKYLAHELGTYQIELEIQNEDLRIAQQELERSRDKYMRLYDFAPVGYFTVDEKSVVHSVNHAGAAMLGFTCAQVPGTAFRTFVRKEDFTRFRKYLAEVFFRQDPQFLEIRMVRTDGSQFYAELRSRVLESADGNESLCQMAVIDVSDRKQAAEFKKWADIFNNTQIGLSIRGEGHTHLEMMNPAFARMHGYTVEELAGTPHQDLYTPEERARLPEYFRTADERGSYVHRSVHVRRDGTSFPVEISINVVRNEKGKILYRIINVQDITVRKRAEDELRKSEEKFRVFFELTGVGTAIVDLQTRKFEDINQKLCSMTGYSCKELKELTYQDITHPDDHAFDAKEYERMMSSKSSEYSADKRYMRKDGSPLWVRISASVIKDTQGRPAKAAAVIQEITEQKRAEEEIAMLNRSLLERVADLEAAQRSLKDAYKELESFSYSVSHDLRAPLRHMTGFAKLLRESLKTHSHDKVLEHLNSIFLAGKRMTQLIDDLLDFSRLASQQLLTEKVDLRSVVNEVVNEALQETQNRNIEWKIEELPVVDGDAAMIKLVFENLIANAIKFTAPRDPAVIEIGNAVNEDEFVIFVRDNGVGFDMKHAGKLYGVFQRMHTQSEFTGTGIGLANVHRIVTRHGGVIWAEAYPGKGATFFFSLPRNRKMTV